MRKHEIPYLLGLGMMTTVSLVLLAAFTVLTGTFGFSYLIWNLFLAWVPLVLAYWLRHILQTRLWSSWYALTLTIAWLVFVPNSFYILSDFIHVAELNDNQVLLGAVMIASFVATGMWLGVTSVFMVHQELLKRISVHTSAVIICTVLFISSIAIYVGRDLRWNSWDVLVNPFGILFDLSERLLHPTQYLAVLLVVLPFLALLYVTYYMSWQTARLLKNRG